MNRLSRNKNIKLIKKVRRQAHDFSTKLPYADEKIRRIYYSMADTTHNSTEDMFIKLQTLKRKTKLIFYKKINIYFIEMKNKNFQSEHNPSSKNAQGVGNIYKQVFMNFLQTKPSITNMNNNYHVLCYTVIRFRDEN